MTEKNLDELVAGDLDGSNTPDEAQRLARAIERDPSLLERLEDQQRAARRASAGMPQVEPTTGRVESMLGTVRARLARVWC